MNVKPDTRSQSTPAQNTDANRPELRAFGAVLLFAVWSLRGRMGQLVPVTLALLLITGAAQGIGALHDVSSTLTHQQIAHSWRNTYDLLVRPQDTVSQPERDGGWVNSQGALEDYGGISISQANNILALPQVIQIMPFANVGWQSINVVIPVTLEQKGVFRITAQWSGTDSIENSIVNYVEVTDLAHLTVEAPIYSPVVQHLIMPTGATSIVYAMSVPATQAVIGVAASQENTLKQLLFQGSAAPVHLNIHVDMLNGGITMLPTCVKSAACWQPEPAQHGKMRYLPQGVQLYRYSQARYSATQQQIAAGQLTLDALGEDTHGYIYRTLLQEHVTLPDNGSMVSNMNPESSQNLDVLPLAGPAYIPQLPDAIHFIPLQQACAVNGEQCYSGLYIQLRGVDQYTQQSLVLLQATAAAITARTGLHVDILDGSSPRMVTLSAGKTSPSITTSWRVVGVAVQIVHGVDTLQETLLVLCAVICLLAIGAAGILIGIGRRNEALLLRQVGWPFPLLTLIFVCDALILALPGSILVSGSIILSARLWPGSLPPALMWGLLGMGVITYGIGLVGMGMGRANGKRTPTARSMATRKDSGQARNMAIAQDRMPTRGIPTSENPPRPSPHQPFARRGMGRGVRRNVVTPLVGVRVGLHPFHHIIRPLRASPGAFHMKVTAPLVCAIAVATTTFLIAVELLMITHLNQVLVVTILGNQVRAALEGPQMLLVGVVLLTALLTVGLCTTLLLRGRRQEIALLAMVGWERRSVLLRVLRDVGWSAVLSGEVGALLALIVMALTSAFPPAWLMISVVIGGPLFGVLLVGIVTTSIAWGELKRVATWR